MFIPDLYTDMLWVDRISSSLDGFKKVSGGGVAVCRCPICGDSKRHKSKARFYFYKSRSNTLNVDCKNCGYSKSFYNFMKEEFEGLFEEYKMEQVKAHIGYYEYNQPATSKPEPVEPPIVSHETISEPTYSMVPCLSLPETHPAIEYLRGRSMGNLELSRLFFADDFKQLASEISPTPLSDAFPTEGRIVIPFYDEDGNLDMVQGRALGKSGLRYISIKRSPEIDKVFGKNEIDKSKTVYVCEGPFDSLFVNNCLASCDSSLTRIPADVYIWDNEPRNPDVHHIMKKAIEDGKQVVIWPISPPHKMDINDMISGGLSRDDVMSIIKDNTYSGAQAMLKFYSWRKT